MNGESSMMYLRMSTRKRGDWIYGQFANNCRLVAMKMVSEPTDMLTMNMKNFQGINRKQWAYYD